MHWGNQQQHNLPLIIFLSVFDLIFVFDSCNGYLRPWKSLNFSIQQKVLCDDLMMDYHEIYTKKTCKKINCFVYILTDFGIGSLVIIIYIGHYFLPIAYVIFILTQCLVPVVTVAVDSVVQKHCLYPDILIVAFQTAVPSDSVESFRPAITSSYL